MNSKQPNGEYGRVLLRLAGRRPDASRGQRVAAPADGVPLGRICVGVAADPWLYGEVWGLALQRAAIPIARVRQRRASFGYRNQFNGEMNGARWWY